MSLPQRKPPAIRMFKGIAGSPLSGATAEPAQVAPMPAESLDHLLEPMTDTRRAFERAVARRKAAQQKPTEPSSLAKPKSASTVGLDLVRDAVEIVQKKPSQRGRPRKHAEGTTAAERMAKLRFDRLWEPEVKQAEAAVKTALDRAEWRERQRPAQMAAGVSMLPATDVPMKLKHAPRNTGEVIFTDNIDRADVEARRDGRYSGEYDEVPAAPTAVPVASDECEQNPNETDHSFVGRTKFGKIADYILVRVGMRDIRLYGAEPDQVEQKLREFVEDHFTEEPNNESGCCLCSMIGPAKTALDHAKMKHSSAVIEYLRPLEKKMYRPKPRKRAKCPPERHRQIIENSLPSDADVYCSTCSRVIWRPKKPKTR